jgi:hypothetical protein
MRAVLTWRACPGFSDYQVSDCGDVRRAPGAAFQPLRRLRGVIDPDGYVCFGMIHDDGRKRRPKAHQLVARAFIGPPPSPAHEVAHRNGSRLLNTPANLRWSLQIDNEADREAHGTRPKGAANPKAKISDDDVRYIRRRYREIKLARGRVAELDEQFNICRSQIIRIARGQAWSHVR